MSKKILAMFMATAMAATTFFGCGSTEEASKKDEGSSTTSTDEDASTKTDDEKVTLEVAVSGSAQEIAIHQQKFDLYMKEHPNVTRISCLFIVQRLIQKYSSLSMKC